MKKIETVMQQLSNLYEFYQKLHTYKIQKTNNVTGQQPAQLAREKCGSVSGKVIDGAGSPKH